MCNTLLKKVTAPWMTVRTIQKEVWMMLDRDTDVNDIVKMLEEKAKWLLISLNNTQETYIVSVMWCFAFCVFEGLVSSELICVCCAEDSLL